MGIHQHYNLLLLAPNAVFRKKKLCLLMLVNTSISVQTAIQY